MTDLGHAARCKKKGVTRGPKTTDYWGNRFVVIYCATCNNPIKIKNLKPKKK